LHLQSMVTSLAAMPEQVKIGALDVVRINVAPMFVTYVPAVSLWVPYVLLK